MELATVGLVYLTIAIPIAWWAPYVRYDAFLYPLMAIGAAAGMHVIFTKGNFGRTGQLIVLAFAVSVWMLAATQDTYRTLRKSRHRELAFYQAMHQARKLPGKILFEDRYSITNLYFPKRALYASEMDPISFTGVDYIVTSTQNSDLLEHTNQTISIQQIAHYRVEQGNSDINEMVILKPGAPL